MENVRHEKEEEGVFYGAFSYMTDGAFAGQYEAKCSHACVNIILQQARFVDGLAVTMDDRALKETIDSLHITKYFGLTGISEMENLFLVNWKEEDLEVFGSLLAIYHVLKSENLSLLPLTATLHPTVQSANTSPENMKGYLYFLEQHWMVLRQLGNQWYKFDTWLGGPQLLTHFYVSLYVKQLLADGKLVFVVEGNFPQCAADVDNIPEELIEPEQPNLDSEGKPSIDMTEQELAESLRFLDLVFENEDNQLALGLLLSLEDDIRKTKLEEAPLMSFSASCSASPSQTRKEGECSVQRKNGTVENPLILKSQNEYVFNTSSDSDDYSGLFSVIFNEPGEGARCLTSPATAQCPINFASTSADPVPAPSVVISSSELSSFKKAVVRGDDVVGNNESLEERNCCVCWAQAPSHVVVPCGHFCLCSMCSVNILKPQPDKSFCPLCKQETTAIIKLFK